MDVLGSRLEAGAFKSSSGVGVVFSFPVVSVTASGVFDPPRLIFELTSGLLGAAVSVVRSSLALDAVSPVSKSSSYLDR